MVLQARCPYAVLLLPPASGLAAAKASYRKVWYCTAYMQRVLVTGTSHPVLLAACVVVSPRQEPFTRWSGSIQRYEAALLV